MQLVLSIYRSIFDNSKSGDLADAIFVMAQSPKHWEDRED